MHIKKKNSIYALIIFFLVISIGLGYSLISTSLSITGGISVAKKRNIYFDNLVVKEGSVTPDMSPTIRKNSTQTTFTVTLTNVSDYYEFNLDIVNDSDKDMMLKEIIKTGLTEEQSSLIDYTVTYSNGEEINVKDQLVSYFCDTITVKAKFKDGLTAVTSQTLNLSLKLIYEDDDGTSTSRLQNFVQMMSSSAKTDAGISFSNGTSSTAGIYFRNNTINNEFPIYYYHGGVDNNNVMFANYCWKIVRTTETGGTKLIYNGAINYTLPTTDALSYDEYTIVSNNSNYSYTYDETTKMWTVPDTTYRTVELSFKIKTAGDYILEHYKNSESSYYNDTTYIYIDGKQIASFSNSENRTVILQNITPSNVIKISHYDRDGVRNTFKIGLLKNATAECNNTGTKSQLPEKSYFNQAHHSDSSFVYVGYMYGDNYTFNTKGFPTGYSIYHTQYVADSCGAEGCIYGKSVIYEDGKYKLQDTIDIEQITDYSTLVGYYTCSLEYDMETGEELYCAGGEYYDTYQIVAYDLEDDDGMSEMMGGTFYMLPIKDGETQNDSSIILSETITDNQDGTYTLSNPISIKKIDWYTTYNNYQKYYLCDDVTSTTCEFKNQINSVSNSSISYGDGAGYIFGNDVTWDGEKYTLIDTYIVSTDYRDEYKEISKKYHYTCFDDFGSCKTVYYIIESYSSWDAQYLTLNNGKKIDDAKNEMFSSKTNSTVKTTIDNWYKTNMINYTNKLEDTIWCNDRGMATTALKSKDTDSSKEMYVYFDTYNRNFKLKTPSLMCQNQNDRFTVNASNGNGALTYPVGLLTADEVLIAGTDKTTYLYTGEDWWTMSPHRYYSDNTQGIIMDGYDGELYNEYTRYLLGVRPAISLLPDTKIYGGNGTSTKPYIVR